MARNTNNLRPWKRGQSGNPGGRPKSLKNLRELLEKAYGTDARGLVERLEGFSKQRRHPHIALQATELLLAYHSGKPTQRIEQDFNPAPLFALPEGTHMDIGWPRKPVGQGADLDVIKTPACVVDDPRSG